MKENMYYGAHPLIFQRAQELRAVMTPAEEIIWKQLHINSWGVKFRRQHPIANYVVDFYCHPLKLVIEIDGSIHDVEEIKRNDQYREDHLKDLGLSVLRISNRDVFSNTDQTLATIANEVNRLKNSPSGVGGQLFVVKIGGNVIDNEEALSSFLQSFAAIEGKKILVHGGGKIATQIGDKLGIESKYINGRRITNDAVIDTVTMVYGGLVNKKIVAKLQSLQCNAIGLTGADANIIPAVKRPVKEVDFGWVGDVENSKIKGQNLKLFLDAGLRPVFAPLTHDEKGHILNTNADTIASSLAVALSDDFDVRLIYCFEKKGVLEDVNDENSVITSINKTKYRTLIEGKKLFEGIIPKIDNAFAAIDSGVSEVLIGHADDLLQNTTNETKGTLISAE